MEQHEERHRREAHGVDVPELDVDHGPRQLQQGTKALQERRRRHEVLPGRGRDEAPSVPEEDVGGLDGHDRDRGAPREPGSDGLGHLPSDLPEAAVGKEDAQGAGHQREHGHEANVGVDAVGFGVVLAVQVLLGHEGAHAGHAHAQPGVPRRQPERQHRQACGQQPAIAREPAELGASHQLGHANGCHGNARDDIPGQGQRPPGEGRYAGRRGGVVVMLFSLDDHSRRHHLAAASAPRWNAPGTRVAAGTASSRWHA
mmetsp:Transcript_20225/g.61388  ORF Transcript_20225/g.61388 Transcript_20225/m.61388 type:complete len:257 (-) Transcript_20225:103-873(-)